MYTLQIMNMCGETAIMVVLKIKQNQAISVILVSIKAPEMT